LGKDCFNKGTDITFADLVVELEKLRPGIHVHSISKPGITAKDIAEGKGINLWSKTNVFEAAAIRARAQLPNTTHNQLRASLQRDIDNFELMEKKKFQNVAARYMEVYGPLITPDRNYIVLDGSFLNAAGEQIVIPPIVFIFKAGTGF